MMVSSIHPSDTHNPALAHQTALCIQVAGNLYSMDFKPCHPLQANIRAGVLKSLDYGRKYQANWGQNTTPFGSGSDKLNQYCRTRLAFCSA
jgi:hypothetical protein